jgi:hypothetical protein
MKTPIILLALLITTLLSSYKYNTHPIIGKTYEAEVGASCKIYAKGSCMIYEYDALTFKKDTVMVSNRQAANCTDKEKEGRYKRSGEQSKSYKWTISNDTLTIENFNDYGKLVVKENQLIGANHYKKELVFKEIELKE